MIMGYSFDLLKQIACGLAQHFGDACEIVIHDVRHGIENTILYIENGHVTNRKSGDSASNVVLEAIHADPSTLQDQYSYLTRTEDGRLLDTLIEQALSEIGKPVALMTKDDKVKVVQTLNQAGAFLITKSGDKVASILGISKFTLYNYMDTKK